MKNYDAIILGAGIAGATTAFFLTQKGYRVLVLEKERISSGNSQVAGAFLSPKMSKPSPYKTYLNDAFLFSVTFYKTYFPSLFKQCGLLKLPLNEQDTVRLQSYEASMDIAWEKRGKDYFFPEAGLIEPQLLIKALLEGIEVKEHTKPETIAYHDRWQVDDVTATHLIIATGSSDLPLDIPYLRRKNIGGYRYDTQFEGMQHITHNIHRECSFSCYHDDKVIIGASYLPSDTDLTKAAYHDSDRLLEKAATLHPLKDAKILKRYSGYRSCTFDYFPAVGKVVDAKMTLTQYPHIKKGSRVPASSYIHHPNLYLHTALASRGFVFAPFNAMQLANLIVDKIEIEPHITPERLFLKWARKIA